MHPTRPFYLDYIFRIFPIRELCNNPNGVTMYLWFQPKLNIFHDPSWIRAFISFRSHGRAPNKSSHERKKKKKEKKIINHYICSIGYIRAFPSDRILAAACSRTIESPGKERRLPSDKKPAVCIAMYIYSLGTFGTGNAAGGVCWMPS